MYMKGSLLRFAKNKTVTSSSSRKMATIDLADNEAERPEIISGKVKCWEEEGTPNCEGKAQ